MVLSTSLVLEADENVAIAFLDMLITPDEAGSLIAIFCIGRLDAH